VRWGILKDNLYYPVELKIKIIMPCCLLHNYIRQEMPIDPLENDYEPDEGTEDFGVGQQDDNTANVGTSNEWTSFRDNLAQSMFESWNNA
nr:protein ALP1-like [Tanacetum cinerariifolium]